MRRIVPFVALLALASAEAAAAKSLPVFEVRSQGISAKRATALGAALGVGVQRAPTGHVGFLSESQYGAIPTGAPPPSTTSGGGPSEDGLPTVDQVFNLTALSALKAVDPATASAAAQSALRSAGLRSLASEPIAEVSQLQLFNMNGTQLGSFGIDTHVSFSRRLAGHAIEGPGEQVEVNYAPGGAVTRVNVATRKLERDDEVKLLSGKAADRRVRRRIDPCTPGAPATELTRELVYYAPPLDQLRVRRLHPHYLYSPVTKGSVVGATSTTIEHPQALVPAAKDAPTVTLDAGARGARVKLKADVDGGRGPYRFSFSSCAGGGTPVAAGTSRRIAFDATSRTPGPLRDRVLVTATDADGLSGTAFAKVKVPAPLTPVKLSARPSVGGTADVGAWWFSITEYTQIGAAEFLDEMGDVAHPRFAFGNGSFWFEDFTQSGLATPNPPGGNDTAWGDNIDLAHVQAHSNPWNVLTGESAPPEHRFSSSNPVYHFDANDVQWGNSGGDLEWIGFQACNTMKFQGTYDGIAVGDFNNRWARSFRGVHQMLGFSTLITDDYNFGNEFGDNIADDDMKVRSAWVDAAQDTWGSSRKWVTAGPIGAGNRTNVNDYAFGLGGSTSSDIPSPVGYWLLTGSA